MAKKWFPKKKQRGGKRKRYTDAQKYAYHKRKEKDSYYSRSWVGGYEDKNADVNLAPLENEIERNRKHYDRSDRQFMYGRRNGERAAVRFWKKHGVTPGIYVNWKGKLPE